MGYSMGEYYAHKDAENSNGSVDWAEVPLRYGGDKDTGHPEDQDPDWHHSAGCRRNPLG